MLYVFHVFARSPAFSTAQNTSAEAAPTWQSIRSSLSDGIDGRRITIETIAPPKHPATKEDHQVISPAARSVKYMGKPINATAAAEKTKKTGTNPNCRTVKCSCNGVSTAKTSAGMSDARKYPITM